MRPSLLAALLCCPLAALAQTTTSGETTTPTATAEPVYSGYVVLKGGYNGSSDDFQGEDFGGSPYWELAVGGGRTLGLEASVGYLSQDAGGLEITQIPVLLTLRLALPVAFAAPFAEGGVGLYFVNASLEDVDTDIDADDTDVGWHAGLGVDLHFGAFLVGAEARYQAVSPDFDTIDDVSLESYTVMGRVGLRF